MCSLLLIHSLSWNLRVSRQRHPRKIRLTLKFFLMSLLGGIEPMVILGYHCFTRPLPGMHSKSPLQFMGIPIGVVFLSDAGFPDSSRGLRTRVRSVWLCTRRGAAKTKSLCDGCGDNNSSALDGWFSARKMEPKNLKPRSLRKKKHRTWPSGISAPGVRWWNMHKI